MENWPKFQDRRRGPDILVKWVKWASIISWLIVIAIIFIIDKAKPPVETFFERFFNVKLRKTWNEDLLQYSFYLLIALFIFCVISLIFNAKRNRRKTDKLSKSIIFNTILSFIGIVTYLFLFL